jgi:hypothetical protein
MPLYEADFLGEPTPIKSKGKGKQKQKSVEVETEESTPVVLQKEKGSRKRKSSELDPQSEQPELPNKSTQKKKPEVKEKPEPKKKPEVTEPKKKPEVKETPEPKKKPEVKEKPEPKRKPKSKKGEDLHTDKLSTSTSSNSDGSEYETVPTVSEKIKIRKKKAVSGTVPEKASKVTPKVQLIASQQESNETQPPQWFRAYVLDEQKRRNQEKLKKERQPQTIVKEIADEVAKQEWENPTKRGMINNEVDRHMSRMYQMIHGRRL